LREEPYELFVALVVLDGDLLVVRVPGDEGGGVEEAECGRVLVLVEAGDDLAVGGRREGGGEGLGELLHLVVPDVHLAQRPQAVHELVEVHGEVADLVAGAFQFLLPVLRTSVVGDLVLELEGEEEILGEHPVGAHEPLHEHLGHGPLGAVVGLLGADRRTDVVARRDLALEVFRDQHVLVARAVEVLAVRLPGVAGDHGYFLGHVPQFAVLDQEVVGGQQPARLRSQVPVAIGILDLHSEVQIVGPGMAPDLPDGRIGPDALLRYLVLELESPIGFEDGAPLGREIGGLGSHNDFLFALGHETVLGW
jgi:hypothetical protein